MASKYPMKLFPRYEKTGHLYARFMVRGKRHVWCTRTDDKAVAAKRARAHRELIVAKEYHLADLQRSNNGMPTIKQVMDEYLALPVGGATASRKTNLAALRLLLAAGGVAETDGIFRIDGALGMGWQTHCLSGKAEQDKHSATVTCNSRLRKAKAVFAKKAMRFYATKFKMPAEQIAGFVAVPFLRQHETQREVPSNASMEAAERLLSDGKHKAEWSAYLLAKYAGMRPIEIERAPWAWLDGDVIHVGGKIGVAGTKSGRFRNLRLDAGVVAHLSAAKTDDNLICGPRATYTVRRVLPGLLLQCGFPSPDPVYSLRRWHASWRYENQSPSAARDALGHSTESVTMKHYARRLTAPAAIPLSHATPPPSGQSASQCETQSDG